LYIILTDNHNFFW